MLSIVYYGLVSQNHQTTGLPGCRPARLAKGWSQQKLAEMADCSLPYIGLVELGKTDPSIHKARRIADALGVSLEELLSVPNEAA